ncbi:ankyrin repeat, SAM and basic leucine zipper domain-containing protein 1 isoform X2 [Alligator sinensis]|uniref:Ankyrin repeat, SAM and basic leucine zipper domain-containing protein 1 n=2 Tax=Alligator sinensis TaxID=38654 RepID=A0A1U7S3B3_ALLSI|nr:ankyrin repeat, SAM and basic leucine zipper domain-containing protein 1 isoform X2 [Alligator sinensis]
MARVSRSLAAPGGCSDSDSDEDCWFLGLGHDAPQPELPLNMTFNDTLQIKDKEERLKKALTSGNVSLVEELLNSGVSVDISFQFGWTPLMYAASVANVELVHILLDRGANASFEKDQYTVLMSACTAHASEEQILKCVELLLSRNANPSVACRKKMSPLMYAAREGHPQVVALLVAHGSQINGQDENGYTALMWAARQGHKRVIFKLLELGADKSLQTKDGKTAGEIAKSNKHSELFSLLSLTANPLQGRVQSLVKEEAVHKLLKAIPDAPRGHSVSSYTAFGDLEVFLHGLGLEHMAELLKERDITLRQLLTMGKDDFAQFGITNTRDQQKILEAAKELQIEELKFGELPEVMKLEFSGDEFLTFLLKLNRQCGHLTAAVQSIITQLPSNSQKIVLEWGPPQSFTKVCEDLVCSVEDLGEEVSKLKDLMQKFQNGQKNDPSRVQLLERTPTWKNRLIKKGAVTLFGFGIVLLMTKVTLRKT